MVFFFLADTSTSVQYNYYVIHISYKHKYNIMYYSYDFLDYLLLYWAIDISYDTTCTTEIPNPMLIQ